MAGIGFELRKLLKQDTFFGMLRAYTYAGLISSGPWVISILALLFLGIFGLTHISPPNQITQFQTSVTYLISSSLIATGLLQLAFNRFISDQLYMKHTEKVLPNFFGLLLVVTIIGSIFSGLVVTFTFGGETLTYKVLMALSFVTLSNIWMAVILLAGLKKFKSIVVVFFIGYSVVVICGMELSHYGLNGLMLGFLIGHIILLIGIIYTIIREYPSPKLIEFKFFNKRNVYWSLVITGFLYNLAIWADKYVFWFNASTSEPVIGPLRYSPIYDLPIFLAYLAIIPGMAIFLVRMETDFVEYYQKFFDAVLKGGSLSHIREVHSSLITTARQGIFEIIKIQAIAVMVVFVMGPTILHYLNIPQLYIHLLNIDVVATGLQIVFLAIMNVLFYLDKRLHALLLSALFAILNIALTQLSIYLGVYFFGYGFASALLICVALGMYILDYDLERLEYETFMLQR